MSCLPDIWEEESQDRMAAIPTSTEILRVPGEGYLGSCGDGDTKAWENAAAGREAGRARLQPLRRCPWC